MSVHIVLIGEHDSPRVKGFVEACAQFSAVHCEVVPYLTMSESLDQLREKLKPDSIIRIESPGKNFSVEKLLLKRGYSAANEEPVLTLSPKELEALSFCKGAILPSRQWYLGFKQLLQELKQIGAEAGCDFLNRPDDIATMFDKIACQKLFQQASIPSAMQLGEISSFEELREKIRTNNCSRVFLKLAHGSSASGLIAFRMNQHHMQACSTIELEESGPEKRLYNSRKLKVLNNHTEIEKLVNLLCHDRVFAEEWIVKANHNGQSCDLRIVTIDGIAKHKVLRLSSGPFTNLHLLNQRAETDEFESRMGSQWQSILKTTEAVARIFPRSLYMGIDLLVSAGLKKHAVAEVNAFGDHLKDVYFDKHNTYTSELMSILNLDTLAASGTALSKEAVRLPKQEAVL